MTPPKLKLVLKGSSATPLDTSYTVEHRLKPDEDCPNTLMKMDATDNSRPRPAPRPSLPPLPRPNPTGSIKIKLRPKLRKPTKPIPLSELESSSGADCVDGVQNDHDTDVDKMIRSVDATSAEPAGKQACEPPDTFNPIQKKNMEKIVEIFDEHVKGKKNEGDNTKHNGAKGHVLERLMNLKPNCDNKPDIHDFEMKTETSSKISLGDWAPNYKIFAEDTRINKKEFYHLFGKPNKAKHGRLSYTRPKLDKILDGKTMIIDNNNNVIVKYIYTQDTRVDKASLIPKWIQELPELILERWDAGKLDRHIKAKFGQSGWFICYQTKDVYTHIEFYPPFDYNCFLKNLKLGVIYQDGVPYQTNNRWYSQWRVNNNNISYFYQYKWSSQ